MNIALIFAGGSGTRMGKTTKPKQFMDLNGRAVIINTVLNFEKHRDIDAIAVVCADVWQSYLRKLLDKEKITKVKWIVSGGQTGQQSIFNGVKVIYDNVEDKANTIVLINDGVRPLVGEKVITDNINCVKKNGTSVTAAYATETILEVDGSGKVCKIPDRRFSLISKAPQGFILEQIMDVHLKAIAENKFGFTNSAELMLHYGYDIYIVEDSSENIKITNPIDLFICKFIMKSKAKD